MKSNYESWGKYPVSENQAVINYNWISESPDLATIIGNVLPFGLGRSYGDSCLNSNGTLIDCSGLNKFISVDWDKGLLRAEAGVSLDEILKLIVPKGFFLAVTPGTKFVTLGGAIANDVHGKNHHKMGTFGCHVNCFELLRSTNERFICSHSENQELFRATIGGLGLTGIITWAEINLFRIDSSMIDAEFVKFDCLNDFFEINDYANLTNDFTVSWIDCTSTGTRSGRGIYSSGNFAKSGPKYANTKHSIDFPFKSSFINELSVNLFNVLYYQKQFDKKLDSLIHYEPFFYPLDAVGKWNNAYGKNGFIQYQFVLPFDGGKEALKEILKRINHSGLSSFLTVLKTFGNIKSPGILSFPRPGITLAIDFRMTGKRTLDFLSSLDVIVRENGGVIYPAKDSRMSGADFIHFYPEINEFSKYIDPKFSSSFWRRVNN
jgi:FAD/FMN-containing dehydrogenase